jgi:hypothetical protein
MRKSTFTIALVLLAVAVWFGLHDNSPRAADAAKPAAQKWEYLQRNWEILANDKNGLNDLGDKGWEMCGISPGRFTEVIFKRPKQ